MPNCSADHAVEETNNTSIAINNLFIRHLSIELDVCILHKIGFRKNTSQADNYQLFNIATFLL